ncbi:hypothetical protein [Flavivirga aquatica]|uniref:hypothetical protein n=1 Tax=Flavivirga aquatica TaxID=1849968 RepID=UPI0013F4D132|nr:hypothetical protein [Flavivirga aquatica]
MLKFIITINKYSSTTSIVLKPAKQPKNLIDLLQVINKNFPILSSQNTWFLADYYTI